MVYSWRIGGKYYLYGIVYDVMDYLERNAGECNIEEIIAFPSPDNEHDDFIMVVVSGCELGEEEQ